MTEQDKQVIEELAQLLGWSECEWILGDILIGKVPCQERDTKAVFPASYNSGNGMLWVLGEIHDRGIKTTLTVDPHDDSHPVKDMKDLPMYVNHAAPAVLKAKAGAK